MNWQHTRITLSPISGSVLLTASAGAEVWPIVDMKGVNEAFYVKDLAECQEYAKEAPGMGSTAAKGAGAGAVVGGAGGAYKGNESQEAVVKKCLVGRGYKVLN
jgi:hypothetical protein